MECYGAIDRSWQVWFSHIHRRAGVPLTVPQFWLSSTIPLFSTTSSYRPFPAEMTAHCWHGLPSDCHSWTAS